MKNDLNKRRLDAALASKGTSADPIYELVLKLIKSFSLCGDLLEFGAGTGRLIARIVREEYRGSITAMDILSQPEALPTSVKWIEADLNNPTVAADSSYDVIISTEVIEHLENPRGVFRELHRLLRPGGTLIVTTPNQESIRSYLCLLLDGHYAGFRDASYPAHITALLRKDFERVCGETGFAPPRFFYTECGGIPKFPRFHWQEVLFGLARGRLFSDNVAIKTEKC